MAKFYTISTNNLYIVTNVLIHFRVPFSFRPHKAYKNRKFKSPYGANTLDIEIDEEFISISNILFELDRRYGSTFEFTILTEV